MSLDKAVCYYMKIAHGKVEEAVNSGVTTLEEVQKKTGAGTICRKCCGNLKRLVEDSAADRRA